MDIKAIVNELNKLQELLNERVKLKEDIRLLRIENSKLKDELVYQKNKQEPLPE